MREDRASDTESEIDYSKAGFDNIDVGHMPWMGPLSLSGTYMLA